MQSKNNKFVSLFNLNLKYKMVLKGLALRNAIQDLKFKQNQYQSLMPGFVSIKMYMQPSKYSEQPEFYTFKQPLIKKLRSRVQIRVRRFQREMESYNFGMNQQLPVKEVSNKYSFNLLLYYQDRVSRNILNLILSNIYKEGELKSTYLNKIKKQQEEQLLLKDYYEDKKLRNFIKYSQPYLSDDSDSE